MESFDKAPGGGSSSAPRSSRDALKRRLFRKCDRDEDGFLKKGEMRNLACLVGFEGNDNEWSKEYEKLCSEHRIRPDDGVPLAVVMILLDDKSDNGCYCTDKEIQELLNSKDVGAPMRPSPAFDDEPVQSKLNDGESLCKVFFAGANFNTEEDDLYNVFEKIGRIEDFVLFRMQDQRSRGMGVVTYTNPEDAQRAIATLHKTEVDGRSLLVQEDTKNESGAQQAGNNRGSEGYSGKGKGKDSSKGWKGGKDGGGGKDGKRGFRDGGWKGGYDDYGYDWDYHQEYSSGVEDYYGYETDGRTVFFAGASFDTTPQHLRRIFAEAGRIKQFWLFQLPDGRSRGMGVVQYEDFREAQYSIEVVHSKVIDGRSLLVKIDDVGAMATQGMGYDSAPKGGEKRYWRGGKGSSRQSSWSNRVYYAGAPYHCSEATLRSYFEEIGSVRSFTVFWLNDGRHRGMGVCTYATSDIAERALNQGITIEGRPLFLQEDTSQYSQEEAPAKGKGKGGQQALSYGTSESSSYGGKKGGPASRSASYQQDYDMYGSNANINVDPSKAVFFANVPFEVTETFLKSKFEQVGPVKSLVCFTTPDGKSRGMGVVEYTSQAGAMRAYDRLHEMVVCGRTMIVDEYRQPH